MARNAAILTASLLLLLVACGTPADAQGTRGAARDVAGGQLQGSQMLPQGPRFGANAPPSQAVPELAPRPRLDIEPPRAAANPDGQPQLAPAFIAPRIPGRGFAQENASPGSLNERLFRPAPGARVSIPMTW